MAGAFNFRMMIDPKREEKSSLRTLANNILWERQQEKHALPLYIHK